MDDDEAVELAREKGLPFTLDHLGYDGLANIVLEEWRLLFKANKDIQEWVSENGSKIPEDLLRLLSNLDHIVRREGD